jgi:hypothetical protein
MLQAFDDPKTVLFFFPSFHFPLASLGKFGSDADTGSLSHLFCSFCQAGSLYVRTLSVGHCVAGVSALARAFLQIVVWYGLFFPLVVVVLHHVLLGRLRRAMPFFFFTLLSNRRYDEGDGVYTKQRLPCEAYTSFEHLHAWHFSKVIIIIVS